MFISDHKRFRFFEMYLLVAMSSVNFSLQGGPMVPAPSHPGTDCLLDFVLTTFTNELSAIFIVTAEPTTN